jgi:hypothetical protein
MESPLIADFVEKKHEIKVRRGAAKQLRAELALQTAIRQSR